MILVIYFRVGKIVKMHDSLFEMNQCVAFGFFKYFGKLAIRSIYSQALIWDISC